MRSIQKLLRHAALGMLLLLGALPLAGQAARREAIYQRAVVGDHVFEGVVISKDGRRPQAYDPYWRLSGVGLDRPKGECVPFQYLFRVSGPGTSGPAKVEEEIRLDQLPFHEDLSRIGRFGPLWFAGFDPGRGYVWFFRYEDEDVRTLEVSFYLFVWDIKGKKFLDLISEVGKGSDFPQTSSQTDAQWDDRHLFPPKAALSPSGKYLAVLVWDHDPDQQLQEHLEVYRLDGVNSSLQEREAHEVAGMTRASQVGIAEFHWNPGDQLECAFTTFVPPSFPEAGQGQKAQSAPPVGPTCKTYVYADTLFTK